jgi:hypothetical protein
MNSVITRVVAVAAGRFAPGHLGELTQHLPFEMVDEALRQTRTTRSRIRDLPSRVVVYLLLAACLFGEVGYPGVWRKLTAGLDGIPTVTPTAGALAQARRRVGVAPLRWLFDLLRGPAATARHPVAGAAGVRDRRHHADRGRWPGDAVPLHQAGRQPWRHRLSSAAPAGAGGLRHPHPHRRGLRPHHHGGDQLRPGAAAESAAGNDPVGRPQLRRERLAGRRRGDRSRGAGAPEERPQDAGAGPLRRRLLPVDARHRARARDRLRDHHQHHGRPTHRPVPAWPPRCSTTTATRPPT